MLTLLVLATAAAARELDPAACAQRFDVQRDKIIRTEESREMGARYLSELDVGTRHECRRLCCETDSCDVFVYEEKSPGSCYLFNCGPPEDFRCKFTAHSNFSSGVLALSRRLAELQDQERLAAAHAAPAPPSAPPPRPPPPTATTPATSSTPPAPAPLRTATPRPHAPSSRCSRYQWECHTGGECIAVYNACDGVPQCADGSDEAPELGCPVPNAGANLNQHREPSAAARTPPSPPVVPVFPAQVYEGGSVGPRWPHRLLQAQPQLPHDPPESEGGGVGVSAGSPHIFAHGGGLLQAGAGGAFEGGAGGAWPRRQYPPPHPDGWGWGRAPSDWDRRLWPQSQPSDALINNQPELSSYGGGAEKPMPELAVMYGPSAIGTLGGSPGAVHDGAKKGPRPVDPPTAPPPPPAPPRTVADNTTKKKAAAIHSEATTSPPSSSAREIAADDHAHAHVHTHVVSEAHARIDDSDGLSERPPSAVLLLILGLAMTGALGAGLAVRARGGRRRGRGRALAHDADYLVNGMYL